MRICFFGHAEFIPSREIEAALISNIELFTRNGDVEFFFGGYGNFDDFALQCVKKIYYHHQVRTVYVTPYLSETFLKNRLEYKRSLYDEVIYPEIEKAPYKFAITMRNRWMVDKSDVIIGYVNNSFGGAYSAVQYARRKKKEILNLGRLKI